MTARRIYTLQDRLRRLLRRAGRPVSGDSWLALVQQVVIAELELDDLTGEMPDPSWLERVAQHGPGYRPELVALAAPPEVDCWWWPPTVPDGAP